jgi:hypothetical protein
MFIDALGKCHFEFWTGLKMAGRTFQSVPLFQVCQEFGDAQVQDACMSLDVLPYDCELAGIKAECQRVEDAYW